MKLAVFHCNLPNRGHSSRSAKDRGQQDYDNSRSDRAKLNHVSPDHGFHPAQCRVEGCEGPHHQHALPHFHAGNQIDHQCRPV